MKKSEIQLNLENLVKNFVEENFIFDFLTSFGLSKTTITRLKNGDYNLSKKDGELFYKGKIFFRIEKQDNLLEVIDELSKSDKIRKQKPRFILVTDFQTVLAIDTKLGNNKEFALINLGDYVDFFLPLSGAEIYRVSNDNKLDRDAAYKLGELYDILVADNPEWIANGSHQLNIFLSRILFCFFAEDTGIFDGKSIFTETLANNTAKDGSDVATFLSTLFRKLNSPHGQGEFPKYLGHFPYVNGGLFRDDIQCPNFSKKARQILIDSGELDWSEINPDIFGSMIQAVADPEERNNLGMHYTSVINILKLIKPLFLDDLYEEFEKQKSNKTNLKKLLHRLGKIKFFDPACGSGNFLIITYKELRNLEIQIIKQLLDLDEAQREIYFSQVKLSQFYGIEIKDFAHEMAILSLWLAQHQLNQVFEQELLDYGKSTPILPLQQSGNITQGNAVRVNWEEVCPKEENDEIYIIGNPPYLGSFLQSKEQKSDLAFVCTDFKSYKDLDYIACWFIKSSNYIERVNAKFAFVTTNSICQGEQVTLLWPYITNKSIEIYFAYQSFKWTNNAKGNAGVSVVILGLRNISNNDKYLYFDNAKKGVKNISPYLTTGSSINLTKRMKPLSNLPPMSYGSKIVDGGHLIFSTEEKERILLMYPDSYRLFKRLMGSAEFIRGQERWIIYLQEKDLEYANTIPEIKERLLAVTDFRSKSTERSTREMAKFPHKFYYSAHSDSDVIIIPRTSSERRQYIPMGFLNGDTIISDAASAVFSASAWIFGVINSNMHMIWVKTVGGRLKTDYRYSSQLCYNTFPFPNITDKQKEIITQYVFSVLDERAKYPEKTMAWLYNPETMPAGLKQAHKELDEAIERIYRLATFSSDEERLEYLFKMYDEMSRKVNVPVKQKKVKEN